MSSIDVQKQNRAAVNQAMQELNHRLDDFYKQLGDLHTRMLALHEDVQRMKREHRQELVRLMGHGPTEVPRGDHH